MFYCYCNLINEIMKMVFLLVKSIFMDFVNLGYFEGLWVFEI